MASIRPVRKAVLPVAGLGTRFLPATKVTPKELLTVVDKPVLQYVVDEAKEAGIDQFIFVTGRGKGAIEDYFDQAYELEATLASKNKKAELELLKASLPEAGAASFVRQQAPLGLGHAVWCARHLVGDEPFAVMLPDMLMSAKTPALAQAVETYNKVGGNIIMVESCTPEEAHKYGIVAVSGREGRLARMTGMVEKPAPGTAPSNLFISGRYILQPEIFTHLSAHERGAGGEIQLTDAMLKLLDQQSFHALEFDGVTYDCGDKLGYLRATVALALQRKDLGPQFREALKDILK
jgi:UTP--glucose-1-phosphate uridylyltransferase